MPPTDYSKTVIYEIKCKNPQVKYSEIGATTNLKCVRYRFRKLNMETNNLKLCQEITANGGVDNWEIIVLESYTECSSKAESNSRVEYWKNRKKTNVNREPKRTKIEENEPISRNPLENSTNKYICKICDGEYRSKQNYENHLLTAKHKKNIKSRAKTLELHKNRICEHCSTTFSTHSSLKRHQTRCKVLKERNTNLELRIEELQRDLEQKNKELQDQQVCRYTKKGKNNQESHAVTNNNTINTNNTINVNNTIINNVNVSYRVQLGSETIADALTDSEKQQVLSKIHGSLKYYIHKVHFSGQYPEYLNVALTNLRSKYAHKYSEIEQKFITELAENVFTEMVDTRFSEICDFYDERKAKLNTKMESRLNNFIDGMKNNPEKYKQAMDDVMLMAYNHRDKVDMNNCVNKPEPLQIQNNEDEEA